MSKIRQAGCAGRLSVYRHVNKAVGDLGWIWRREFYPAGSSPAVSGFLQIGTSCAMHHAEEIFHGRTAHRQQPAKPGNRFSKPALASQAAGIAMPNVTVWAGYQHQFLRRWLAANEQWRQVFAGGGSGLSAKELKSQTRNHSQMIHSVIGFKYLFAVAEADARCIAGPETR